MRGLWLLCTGCMISAGPAVGFRGGHATIGGDVGAGLPFARIDYSRTYQIDAGASAQTVDTFVLNFAIPFKSYDPATLGGVLGLGYGRSGGKGNGVFAAGGFVAHVGKSPPSDRGSGETNSLVAAAAGVRYMPGATEVFFTPQVGEMWAPGIHF
jgi:hypothetical protein